MYEMERRIDERLVEMRSDVRLATGACRQQALTEAVRTSKLQLDSLHDRLITRLQGNPPPPAPSKFVLLCMLGQFVCRHCALGPQGGTTCMPEHSCHAAVRQICAVFTKMEIDSVSRPATNTCTLRVDAV